VTLAIEGFSSQPLESLYRASSVIRRAAEFEATAVGQVEVLIGIESDQASRVAKALAAIDTEFRRAHSFLTGVEEFSAGGTLPFGRGPPPLVDLYWYRSTSIAIAVDIASTARVKALRRHIHGSTASHAVF
jgi:hypothetical protein